MRRRLELIEGLAQCAEQTGVTMALVERAHERTDALGRADLEDAGVEIDDDRAHGLVYEALGALRSAAGIWSVGGRLALGPVLTKKAVRYLSVVTRGLYRAL